MSLRNELMMTLLAIGFGGAFGAIARFLISQSVTGWNLQRYPDFPLGTWTVNVIGAFFIGILFVLFSEKLVIAEQWRPLLVIGLLGSMTTFSTFSLEALLLLQKAEYGLAFFYIIASVAVCLFATYIGMQSSRLIF